MLTNENDKILLVKRGRDPFKDYWDIPGGFVEEHETLEEAARRELKEETELEVTKLKYIGSVFEDYHFREDIIPIVGAIFEGSVDSNVNVKVGDDVVDYKFVTRDKIDLNEITFGNQREFLRSIL